MDIAVKQFYERFIDSLIEAEKGNQQDYQSLKNDFFDQLEGHLDHAERLSDIVSDLKNVSQRLFFIDDLTRKRAQSLYKDVPAQFDIMKGLLVEACESMYLSVKNENYRDACKFVVIQAEIISEYLIVNNDIVNGWIKKEPALIEKYSLQYPETDTSYLRTKSKLEAASDFSGHTWDQDKFRLVNNIRNYGSHGYHENVLAKHKMDVETVSEEYKEFFNEWFSFIKAVGKKLYSGDKKSEYISSLPVSSRTFKGRLYIPSGKTYGIVDGVLIGEKIIMANKWLNGQEVTGTAVASVNKNTGKDGWKAIS